MFGACISLYWDPLPSPQKTTRGTWPLPCNSLLNVYRQTSQKHRRICSVPKNKKLQYRPPVWHWNILRHRVWARGLGLRASCVARTAERDRCKYSDICVHGSHSLWYVYTRVRYLIHYLRTTTLLTFAKGLFYWAMLCTERYYASSFVDRPSVTHVSKMLKVSSDFFSVW